jgi:hypothetical protein
MDMMARPASTRGPEREGRAPRPRPLWRNDPRLILRFPESFEAYYSDKLGLRDHLLRLHALRSLNVFHTSPTTDVRIGKDNWLFFAGSRSFETHRGLLPFGSGDLADWTATLEARRDFAASIGAAYICAIGPNKETIYPDFLPEGLEPLGPTRLDQLVDWLKARSTVSFLDLRPALRAARSADQPGSYLYFEEGTHWNGRGCLIAAQEFKRAAGEHFPDVAASPLPHWMRTTDAFPESWRTKMYLERPSNRTRDIWIADPSELHAVQTPGGEAVGGRNYAIPGSTLPSVVMFHDSFGPVVLAQLAEHFSTARSREFYALDAAELLADPPDLVLDLFVERGLVETMPQALLPTVKTGVVALNADRGHQAQQRRFEASTDRRLVLDPGTAATACGTTGVMQLESVNDSGGPGLALLRKSGLDSLILPPLGQPRAERDLLLLVEIDSAAVSTAELSFQSQGQSEWPREQQVVLPLSAGQNRYWVPLHHTCRVEHLRLRPGRADGERFVLRRFEMRGVERP